jgi:superfamily II DNA or RNA helicase
MLQKYIKNINEFNDIIELISQQKTTKQKGDIFEEFTKYIFLLHPFYENEFEHVWLYNDIPDIVIEKLNLPAKDEGIDLVLQSKDKKYYAVQCKYRRNIEGIIPWDQLGTFTGMAFGIANGFHKAFLVTNTLDITKNIKKSDRIISIHGSFFDEIPDIVFDRMKNLLGKTKLAKPVPLKPFIHQQDAIEQSLVYFNDFDRGYWEMCCAAGKTLTGMWLMEILNVITSVIAVPSLYLLSQIYRDYVGQSNINGHMKNFILVGSECDMDDDEYNNGLIITTDVTELIDKIAFYKNNVVVITTYQSSDKVIEALNKLKVTPDLCIFDEAHKTVGQIGKQFNLLLDDKNLKINKRLFMTATPKMYGGEKNDQIYSMDDEEWYGKRIYTYNTGNAIRDGILCDYQIITMLTNDCYVEKFIKDNKYVKFENSENSSLYLANAIMLLNAFRDGKCHHLVTYHNSIANTVLFRDVLDSLLDIYKLDISILQIDGTSSMKKKKHIIGSFVNSEKAIIVSARVLNEGVNIPIIDSVCFVDNRSSTVDIIQCIGRGLRLHKLKSIAKVFVPIMVEDLDDIDEGKLFWNIVRILKSLSSTDEHIIDYFRCEGNVAGSDRCKLIVHENCMGVERVNQSIDVDDWIQSIDGKVWNIVDVWEMKCKILFDYCDEYLCTPTYKTVVNNIKIGQWLHEQKKIINSTDDNRYNKLSINKYVKENLDEYLKNVEKNKDKVVLSHDESRKLLFQYCDENNCAPMKRTSVNNINIGRWLEIQKSKINSVEDKLYIELSINKHVKNNLDEYLKYVEKNKDKEKLSHDELCKLLFQYCDDNNHVPTQKNKINNINLGSWLQTQKSKINSMEDKLYIKLSSNKHVKDNLDEYLKNVEKNKDKEKLSHDKWCKLLFQYCDDNNKVPTRNTTVNNIKLGLWFHTTQKRKINSSEDELYKKLSTNKYVKDNLDEYLENVEKNKDKVVLTHDEWCNLLFKYCGDNGQVPTCNTKFNNINIGNWLRIQKTKINSSEDELYKKLSTNMLVKVNLDEYLENKDKDVLSHDECCNLLFKYCNDNDQIPTQKTIVDGINIGGWFRHQKRKINNSQDELYKKLSINRVVKNYLDEYLINKDKVILSYDEKCNLLFEYCNNNNKVPSKKTTVDDINIGGWLQGQKRNINSNNDELYEKLSVNKIVKDNLDEYLKDKIKNKDKIVLSYDESCKLLFKYCDDNNKVPTNKTTIGSINIGKWLQHQKDKINSPEDELYKKLSTNKVVKDNLDKYLNKKIKS